MKEYQAARKKLETRRLAYDATLSKMQKQKREDFRVEEELRSQRVKYEESSEDVYRRMGDIQESEAESMADLAAFMEAELEYYDRCRDILVNLRKQWPAGQSLQKQRSRSRSMTAHSFGNGAREESPPPLPVERPSIRSRTNVEDRSNDRVPTNGFRMPTPESSDRLTKPVFQRTHTSPASPLAFEGPTTSERMSRNRSDQGIVPPPLPRTRTLKPDSYYENEPLQGSPDRRDSYYDRGESPARSYGSPASSRVISRSSSNNTLSNSYDPNSSRKQPPPPPPASRKKPPPPPPPMKKSSLSAQQ